MSHFWRGGDPSPLPALVSSVSVVCHALKDPEGDPFNGTSLDRYLDHFPCSICPRHDASHCPMICEFILFSCTQDQRSMTTLLDAIYHLRAVPGEGIFLGHLRTLFLDKNEEALVQWLEALSFEGLIHPWIEWTDPIYLTFEAEQVCREYHSRCF